MTEPTPTVTPDLIRGPASSGGDSNNSATARLGRLVTHSFTLLVFTVMAFATGYAVGLAKGQRMGVAAVMCAMDRIANSKPVGALGASEYCQTIYRQKP